MHEMQPDDFRDFANEKCGQVEKLGNMGHVQFRKGTTQLFYKKDLNDIVSNAHLPIIKTLHHSVI